MKKILSILLVITMVLSMTACSDKDKTNNLENSGSEQTEQIQPDNESSAALNETLYLEPDVLEEAIKSHDFLMDNFTFEKSHNQLIEVYEEDATKYISNETWIWDGIPNVGVSSYEMVGESLKYSVSMSKDAGKDFPSTIGVTFLTSNDTDFKNLMSWTHEMIGSCVPPKLAKAFQNASFEGLTENTYTNGKLATSVYKSTSYRDDGTVLCEMVINITDDINENSEPIVHFSDITDFIVDKGGTLGIYNINIFDQGSTVRNMEGRLAGLFGDEVEAKLAMLSTYTGDGLNNTHSSAYITFGIIGTGVGEVTIGTDIVTELVSGEKTEAVFISGRTLPKENKEDAYKQVENLLDGMFNCKPDFESIVNSEAGGEITLTDNGNNTFGFPLAISLKLVTNEDKTFTVEFNAYTVENVEELKVAE